MGKNAEDILKDLRDGLEGIKEKDFFKDSASHAVTYSSQMKLIVEAHQLMLSVKEFDPELYEKLRGNLGKFQTHLEAGTNEQLFDRMAASFTEIAEDYLSIERKTPTIFLDDEDDEDDEDDDCDDRRFTP